jgi:hypothetical protein
VTAAVVEPVETPDPAEITPTPIQAMIDATNAGDSAAFVASFTENAYVEDWGRGFDGHEGIARWNQSDNIGRSAHFEALKTKEIRDGYIVTLRVTGGGFNGTSDISFKLANGRIREMIISAD